MKRVPRPRRALSYRTAGLLGALGVAVFIALSFLNTLSGCSNQGEGERCEIANGNDDCRTAENLVCTRAQDLTNATSDRCCPVDRSTATTAICKTPVSPVGGDATAPADTGPPTTADASVTSDADTSSDATPE